MKFLAPKYQRRIELKYLKLSECHRKYNLLSNWRSIKLLICRVNNDFPPLPPSSEIVGLHCIMFRSTQLGFCNCKNLILLTDNILMNGMLAILIKEDLSGRIREVDAFENLRFSNG